MDLQLKIIEHYSFVLRSAFNESCLGDASGCSLVGLHADESDDVSHRPFDVAAKHSRISVPLETSATVESRGP